jgi:hypothetical protein
MGRASQHLPRLAKPRVILGHTPRMTGKRGRRKAKTLIGQASRELYNQHRPDDADAMRDILLAAEPGEYLSILIAFVDFFPSEAVPKHPLGDPRTHWAVNPMLAERGRVA